MVEYWFLFFFAQAVQAPAPPLRLQDEIVVTAERGEEERSHVPAATTVITREEIEALPVSELSELIGHVPGFTMLLDGPGGRPTLTARGFFGGGEVDYVQLRVDGVPVVSPETGLADWNRIPLEMIERVEILRGPSSALYGDNALAGVVEVFTRQQDDPSRGFIDVRAGSFGTMGADLSWRNDGGLDTGISMSVERSDGFRDYSATEREFAELFLRTGARSFDASMRASISSLDQEDPGFLSLEVLETDPERSDDLFSRDRNESDWIRVSLDLDWSSPLPVRVLLYGADREASLLRTILLAPGLGDQAWRDTSSRTYGGSGMALLHHTLFGRSASVRFGADLSSDHVNATYFGVTAQGDRANRVGRAEGTREQLALFGTGQWEVTNRIHLTAGMRYDRLEDDFDDSVTHAAWSPRFGINLTLGDGDRRSMLFAQASRAFKAPSVDQLFDVRPFPDFSGGTFTISNTELMPQRAVNLEAGFTHTSAALHWEVVAYRMEVEDEIDFDVATFRYRNISESLHEGLEGLVEWRTSWLTPSITYVWSSVEPVRGPHRGNQLKNIPEHVLRGTLQIPLPASVFFSTSARWMTEWYMDDANEFEMEDAFSIDLRLRRKLARWNVVVDVENLLDEVVPHVGLILPDFQGGEVAYAYPSSGRTVELRLSRNF